MKKNILTIACLLVAAMLLVVSCTPEAEDALKPVEVTLAENFGRSLTLAGDYDPSSFVYKYKMSPKWTNGTSANGYTEGIVGTVSTWTKVVDGKLGWVTPGYWKVDVIAVANDASETAIFEGTNDVYISSANTKAPVYLAPSTSVKGSVAFNFQMQDLEATYGTNIEVRYAIEGVTSTQASGTFAAGETSTSGNITTIQKTVSNIPSGYYRVTVSVYEKSPEKLIGGMTKGFLLANGSTVTIGGHVEPSDYVGSKLNTYMVKTTGTLVANAVPANVATTKQISVKLQDTTNCAEFNSSLKATDFTKTYIWTIDGVESTESNVDYRTAATDKTFTITGPGPKSISCQILYSITVGGTTYYWSGRALDTQVIVPSAGFEYV